MWLKFVVEFLLKEINSIDKEIILKLKMRHLNAICNIVMKLKNKITKYNLKQSKKNINIIKNLIIKLRSTEWYNQVSYKTI